MKVRLINNLNSYDVLARDDVGGMLSCGSNNNNTLAIGRLGDVAVRTAPPSQSSVDSTSTNYHLPVGGGGGHHHQTASSRNNRSVPDIELHYRRGNSDERVVCASGSVGDATSPRLYSRHAPHHSQTSFGPHNPHHACHHPYHTITQHQHLGYHSHGHGHPASKSHSPSSSPFTHSHHHHGHGYQQHQHPPGLLHQQSVTSYHPPMQHHSPASSRPRICEHQPFSFSLSRATSRDSVRSGVGQLPESYSPSTSLRLPPAGAAVATGGVQQLVPAEQSPRSEMLLRQHSQPETSCYHCHTAGSTSLRHLRETSIGGLGGGGGGLGGCDIAGIAADTLRINGAIRQFRQVAFPVGHAFFYLQRNANM